VHSNGLDLSNKKARAFYHYCEGNNEGLKLPYFDKRAASLIAPTVSTADILHKLLLILFEDYAIHVRQTRYCYALSILPLPKLLPPSPGGGGWGGSKAFV
jgi:hypothetical protein